MSAIYLEKFHRTYMCEIIKFLSVITGTEFGSKILKSALDVWSYHHNRFCISNIDIYKWPNNQYKKKKSDMCDWVIV